VSLPVRSGRSRPAFLAIATTAVTLVALAPPGPAGAAPEQAGVYIVQLAGPPIAGYTGGVAGIAATKPTPGAKLDTKTWNFTAYRDHLRAKRAEALKGAKVDAKKTVATFDTTLNGFAAKITPTEAAKLRTTPGVTKVAKSEAYRTETITTPGFLGLEGSGGAWKKQFGDVTHAGEGTVVGIIDTGIWPENPSFAALPEPRPDQAVIDDKWDGECVAADEEPVTCNNKLIGARYFALGTVEVPDFEYVSPRAYNRHGVHVAGTAVGNHDVSVVINGKDFGKASGMAPAARLASYKVCWQLPDNSNANCGSAETVAAVEAAVLDGVDVLNYSISGPTGVTTDMVSSAFYYAAAAGVFVATSAGNEGPGASTVAHVGPWTTTVAASTHSRGAEKSVTLGNGETYVGAGVGDAVPSSPLIDSVTAGKADADPALVEYCYLGTLDPAKVAGKIVLCARGGNARVDKSVEVKNAGGIGMVLWNPLTTQTPVADFHAVPTVHINTAEGTAVKAYAATPGATASLSGPLTPTAPFPQMAGFSSQGPAAAGDGDLLKPDITAPGVDIIAAVSPVTTPGSQNFDSLSGTSMSSPHVAGIAALLKSKNPSWSPMAIKSAMMTTAGQTDNTGGPITRGGEPATPQDYGAGHVRPGSAFNPGIVYESTPLEWTQYSCGVGEHQFFEDGTDVCSVIPRVDPSDFNAASIGIGDLAGKQTITRTVTNTTNQASVYFPRVEAPAGFSVKVTPSALTVLPRKSASYTVEITRTTAPKGTWSYGSLSWSDLRGHTARSPIAVRAADLGVANQILAPSADGSIALSAFSATAGTLNAKAYGPVQSTSQSLHMTAPELGFDPVHPAESEGAIKVTYTVPADAKGARFATFDSDQVRGTDLDLFVFKDGALVGKSAGGTSKEGVSVTEPGTYEVYVVGFSFPPGTDSIDAILHTFLVPGSATGGALTVTPAAQAITPGRSVTVTANWSGLTPGRHYLGVVEYTVGAVTDRTLLVIDP
jgi:subtilisin family serine protease